MKKLILQAGDILRKAYFEVQNFGEKEKGHLLSEYDIKIHNLVSTYIRDKHPDHSVISEEGRSGPENSETYWIVDPIDGTTCFIFGEPYFSISLAKVHNNEVVEAHVYNPLSEEYYFSDTLLGQSFLNDKPISVSATDKVDDALCAFGFSANKKRIDACYNDWQDIFDNCRKGLGWVGPALSICNVARGRIDLFIDGHCETHGQAAAALILKNAGGRMYNYDKTSYDFRVKGGIFTNSRLGRLFG